MTRPYPWGVCASEDEAVHLSSPKMHVNGQIKGALDVSVQALLVGLRPVKF